MSIARHHNEWLALVPVSGPFLSMPVLMRVFPQGLGGHESEHFRTLRLAYEEWSERKSDPAIHKAWIKFVLGNTLELPDEVIDEGQAVMLQATIPEHGETLRPDYVIKNPSDVDNAGKPRLLVCTYPASQNLERPVAGQRWKASPDTRMMELLHRTNCRIGMVTNGEHWMLVDAPSGETTGYISWYSNLWLDENITLRAFRSLLDVRRFFSVPDEDILETMLAESAANQQEVTDQLGSQVRNAVEVLVQSLDRADQDRGGKLLKDIAEEELYEAALTVMMRLVFLFSSEERELLPLDDPLYNQNYAVSTLRAVLRETADQQTEDVLERRRDAWCRLISTFRSVYGGIQHERLTLPAYGGHLLDPDRFPFLEGRASGTTWRDTPATPLPVNNRTILHLLEALQILQVKVPGGGHAEARLLSFRALDIEQIGHVYEGLLDHTANRAPETVLGFGGSKDKEPEIPLSQLEELQAKGEKDLIEFLKNETGRTANPLKKALAEPCAIEHANRCKVACGDDDLWKRVHPFASLIRTDTFGRPVVIREGSVFVTAGTDRRSSGTHYTPRSLTEPIVRYTLEPLVYEGPAEGKPKNEWRLKSATQLLDLNICDMACGSGAFLVQACRYMSQRLLEAWEKAEKEREGSPRITPTGDVSKGGPEEQLIPLDTEERLVYARRIIAARCLYGVDKNPLATEMAKMSLWLLTLAKDKPFEFLDHAIRCGDSLVGLHDLEQLRHYSLKPEDEDPVLFKGPLDDAVDEAIKLRLKLEDMPANTVEDVEAQENLLREAEDKIARLRSAAELLLAAEFWGENAKDKRERVRDFAMVSGHYVEHGPTEEFEEKAAKERRGQKMFHWPLEFSEVIVKRGGFDAFVGNPPFMGGLKLFSHFGRCYRSYVIDHLANGKSGVRGTADLCVYFFLAAARLQRQRGCVGFLATNTISQGDSREVGLDQLTVSGRSVYRATKSQRWPGEASLEVSRVHYFRGDWRGPAMLDGKPVAHITTTLSASSGERLKPHALFVNKNRAFQGSNVFGLGFCLTPEEAHRLIQSDSNNKDVLFPYLDGEDLNSSPSHTPRRWIINFSDWPLDASDGSKGRTASDYPDCLSVVEQKVKPDRIALKPINHFNKGAATRWWQYGGPRHALYAALGKVTRTLVTARVSPTNAVSWMPSDLVFHEKLICFPEEDEAFFAVMQSTLHWDWVREYTSTLGATTLNYSPSACFVTFPFPPFVESMREVAKCYDEHRRRIMLTREEGLTKTYNRFHDPNDTSDDIQKLRELHVEMNQAVATAYCWDDIDLGHGFHETKQGCRYTISEPARREVLQRLLKLNHERYEEEVKDGLHNKKSKSKAGGKRKKKQLTGTPLFE